MERLGVLDAVLPSELAVAREHELLDVVAIGCRIVVAEQRQPQAALGQLRPQPRSVGSRRSLGHVGAVGVDFLVDHLADVDHARDLGPAREVILVGHGVRGQSGGELLGIVVRAAGDPAAGLDGAGRHVVVGILLVVRPGVPGHDGVHLQQADQEDQPAHQLVEGDAAHVMVVVVEIELTLEPEDRHELGVVPLVAEHVLADGAWRSESGRVAHVVVGRADQIAGVALLNELGDGSRRKERNVVGVCLHGEQHLAFVKRLCRRTLEDDAAGRLGRLRSCEPRRGRAHDYVGEEVAS